MEEKKYKHMKLGEMLIAEGVITDDELKLTLEEQKKKKERIGDIIKRLGFATEDEIIRALSKQMGIKQITLDNVIPEPSLLKIFPEVLARKYQLIPLYKKENTVVIVMADPLNIMAIDKVAELTESYVEVAVTKESELMRVISESYKAVKQKDIADSSQTQDEVQEEETNFYIGDNEAPVIKMVNDFITQSVHDGASDIHIEPETDIMRIRQRVDGILRELYTSPKDNYNAVISRLKIMGDLNISEKRVPQDGRCQLKVGEKEIDIRISTLPTIYGEKAVLRLLDKQNVYLSLTSLGLPAKVFEAVDRQVHKPYGMILVTGPTGSGKTSSLYAAINTINSIEKNIVTVEDPVEYQLRVINQVQVNNKVGITFAKGLRSIMRQDPDVIMIGEIRDTETALMAVQASLTGHLVFSTLHSNNTSSSVSRLINMGVEPFLIASSLSCIIAQRLVRKVCQSCKTEVKPPEETLDQLKISDISSVFYSGKGCASCRNTGYKGRTGIFEYLEVDEKIKEMISRKASADEIAAYSVKKGMATLREAAIQKALEGISSLEEVMRVTVDA